MVTAGQRAGLVGETSTCHRIETANVDTAKNPMLRIASGVPWSDPLLELLPRLLLSVFQDLLRVPCRIHRFLS